MRGYPGRDLGTVCVGGCLAVALAPFPLLLPFPSGYKCLHMSRDEVRGEQKRVHSGGHFKSAPFHNRSPPRQGPFFSHSIFFRDCSPHWAPTQNRGSPSQYLSSPLQTPAASKGAAYQSCRKALPRTSSVGRPRATTARREAVRLGKKRASALT